MLFIPSCVKEDLSKISSDFDWNANLSLPVSSISMNSAGFRGGTSLVELYKVIGMVIYTETVEFDLSEIFTKTEYVDSLMLRLDIDNNFPAEIEVFAYYMDESGRVVRNIISDTSLTLAKPDIDAEGNITSVKHVLHDESFSKKDIPDLLKTKQILLRVFIRYLDVSTEVVNKIDDFSIDINIGLRSSVTVSVDEI